MIGRDAQHPYKLYIECSLQFNHPNYHHIDTML